MHSLSLSLPLHKASTLFAVVAAAILYPGIRIFVGRPGGGGGATVVSHFGEEVFTTKRLCRKRTLQRSDADQLCSFGGGGYGGVLRVHCRGHGAPCL